MSEEKGNAKAVEEPDLITNNQDKITTFKRCGFFSVSWKDGYYDVSNRMLLFHYLLTYLGAGAIGGLAYGIKEYFKSKKSDVDDLVEASFIGIFLGIAPSFWIYLLREISTHLPLILLTAKKLEKTETYKKLEYAKKPEVEYKEGYQNEDHNDLESELYKETQRNVKEQWRIVKFGPLVGMVLSVSICVILIIVNCFWDLSNTVMNESAESWEHMKKDLPTFIFSLLYPLPCFLGIWFCIFFLEWQRKIYKSLRNHIRNIKNSNIKGVSKLCTTLSEESKKEIEEIFIILNELQRVFILLNKKIFQKTLVLSFSLFLFVGVFCCCKIINHHNNFVYLLPLSLIMGHLYVTCKWSSDVMEEFREIMEVLNQMPEEDIQDLRRELQECPPQVCAFGGFGVDYSMMTAVIAFMLSLISISGMIWPELSDAENQQCYEYQDNVGEWNYTMCIKQMCSRQYDEFGNWNKTYVCIRQNIDDYLITNRTFSLRNIA